MKITLLSILLLLIFNATYSQNKTSKKEARKAKEVEQYEQIKQLIDSRSFEFIGQGAYPQKGYRVDLTTRANFLRIEGDTVSASLPYFGRAYSGGYGTGTGGIEFNGNPNEFVVKLNEKKDNVLITIKIKGVGDFYSCMLTVHRSGNATLNVSSNNRTNISYQGKVSELNIN